MRAHRSRFALVLTLPALVVFALSFQCSNTSEPPSVTDASADACCLVLKSNASPAEYVCGPSAADGGCQVCCRGDFCAYGPEDDGGCVTPEQLQSMPASKK